MFYVYIIEKGEKKKIYIGYTGSLDQRLKEHGRCNEVDLLYYEAYKNDTDARERERKLKMYGSAWNGLKKRLTLC